MSNYARAIGRHEYIDLDFSRVPIDQTASAGVTVLIAAAATKVNRLHMIVGTMAAGGTITIEDGDGTDLTGPIPVGANGGFVIPFESDPESCLGPEVVNKAIPAF